MIILEYTCSGIVSQLGGGMVNSMCSGASRNGMVANEMLRYPSQGLLFTGINPSAMVGSGMGTDQSGMGLQGVTPPIVPSMHMPTGLLPPVAMPSGMAPMAMAGAAMSASTIPASAIATKSAVATTSAMSMAMAMGSPGMQLMAAAEAAPHLRMSHAPPNVMANSMVQFPHEIITPSCGIPEVSSSIARFQL